MLKSLFAAASQAGVKQSWVTENTLFPKDIPCSSFLFLVMYKMKHHDFESPEMHAGTKLTKQIDKKISDKKKVLDFSSPPQRFKYCRKPLAVTDICLIFFSTKDVSNDKM